MSEPKRRRRRQIVTEVSEDSPVMVGNNLFQCKDCGRTISKNAITCPFCGAPTPYDEFDRVVNRNWEEFQEHLPPKCIINSATIEREAEYWANVLERECGLVYENQDMADYTFGFWKGFIQQVFNLPFMNQELAAKMLRDCSGEIQRSWRKERSIPRCPRCFSDKIRPISPTRKAISIGVFGIFSGDIGKTMVCYNCNYKW